MTRHVVFGTGQIGRLVAGQLVGRGHDVIAVNRSGRGRIRGATVVGGNAADAEFTTSIAAAAEAVYFCLNASHYDRWPQEFPPMQRGVLAGARAAGARLVVLDNLYAYGPVGGRDLVETMTAQPTSAKAATRAAMTTELLDAHRAGELPVVIGRASDYFGPGATQSALGDTVFGTAVTGRTAQLMGDPDTVHSYSYTPDVAAALVTLGTEPAAPGRIWHLPVAPARTTREIVDHVYGLAGHKPKLFAAGRPTLRAIGVVKPMMREYLHTLYQFTDRWVVDDSAFRSTFGEPATPLEPALATTFRWYADRATAPVPA